MLKLLTILLLLSCSMAAQAQLTITGQIRPRAEYRDGFKTLSLGDRDPAFFIEQRSRLGFDFIKDKVQFRLTLQDVRIWGGASQIFKSDNALFNANEAWASYAFTGRSKLVVGRQMLDYDNARILGNLEWAQQSRSHDVVKYEYASDKGFSLHLGAAFNQETVNANFEPARLFDTYYSGVNNYKTMQYAWANKKLKQGSFSFLLLNNGYQIADSTQNYLITTGSYLKTKIGNFDIIGEAYYQFGEDGQDRDVSAYMLALDIGTSIGSLKASAGVDHLSGTSLDESKNNSFNPLFGTNHKFYGFMDYFYVGNSHRNTGLTDVFGKFIIPTGQKSSLIAHLHYFVIPVRLNNADGSRAESAVAKELDLVYNLNIQKDVNWKLGFSAMVPTDSMGLIKNGDPEKTTYWAWTMITFKPVLFKSKV